MGCFVLRQATGVSTGPHSPFRSHSIDAITIRIPRSFGRVGRSWEKSVEAVAEILESAIRSCSNLGERLNRSYYYYLMTGPEAFVPIEIYVIPVVLLLLCVLLKVLRLFCPLYGLSPRERVCRPSWTLEN